MTYIKQFKVILWKNWQTFLRNTNIHLFGFGLFITITFVGILCSIFSEEKDYDKNPAIPPVDITENFGEYAYNKNSNLIGFIFSNNQTSINKTEFINSLMNEPEIKNTRRLTYFYGKTIQPKIFNDEKELQNYIYYDKSNSLLAAVVFNNDLTDYTIRIKIDSVTNSNLKPIDNYGESRKSEYVDISTISEETRFVYTGHTVADDYFLAFVPLQTVIDRTIIKMKTNNTIQGFSADVGKLSKPAFHYKLTKENAPKNYAFNGYAPYISLLFTIPIFSLSIKLLEEKESGMKERLISIGVSHSIVWLSWEVIYIGFSLILVICLNLYDPSNTLSAINRLLYLVILILYSISLHHLVVIISFICHKTKTAIMITSFFLFATVVLNQLIYSLKSTSFKWIERCLSFALSPVSIGMASAEVTQAFHDGTYIGISNMNDSDFGLYFVFNFVDVILYTAIIFILDYLSGIDFRTIGISKSEIKRLHRESHLEDIQEDPVGMECLVDVKGIYKFFKFRHSIGSVNNEEDKKLGKIFAANNDINFKVYKGEIFAILGHNGAGKSTLIKNMIGYLKPDRGETYYGGLPISKNKQAIHDQLGICLQDNIIFNDFTVQEHFKIYAGIKGIEIDIDKCLSEVNLTEKKDYEVQKLSGGQKRKLCVGLAFIGNPKYVFLDEPTTGLDPLSRRKIWNLLLNKKKDRVIFITTHYMDEADIIADRKLILNKGCIRCLGSSIYLKNHFQMKYSLEVETEHPQEVEAFIKQYIPSTESYNNKTEIADGETSDQNKSNPCYIWRLPNKEAFNFSSLLKHLEKEKGHLLIDYSLNSPMLEELFVNLEMEDEKKARESSSSKKENMAIELPRIQSIKRPNFFLTAVRLAIYRFRIYLRRKVHLLMSILFPFLILLFFLNVFKPMVSQVITANYDTIQLSADLYKNQQWNYDINNSNVTQVLTEQVLKNEIPKPAVASKSGLSLFTQEKMSDVGMSMGAEEPYYVSSFMATQLNQKYKFSILYNDSMPHSLPSTINLLSNAILASQNINDTIRTSSHPFNVYDIRNQSQLKFYVSVTISVCMALVMAFYGTNVIYERRKKLFKQIQLNGVSNRSYWLSVLFSDYIWVMITCAVFIATFVICQFSPLNYLNILIVIYLFFAICSIACLVFQYCISFIFNNDNTAYIFVLLINVVPTLYLIHQAYVKRMETDDESLEMMNFLTGIVFDSVFPHYCFVRVVKNAISAGIKHQSLDYELSFSHLFSLNMQIITHYIGALTSILIYSSLLATIIKKKYKPNRNGVIEITEEWHQKFEKELEEGDDDLLKEYRRLKEDEGKNKIPVKFIELTMEYDDLSFNTKQDMVDAMNKKFASKYGEYHMSEYGSRRVVMTPFTNANLGINPCECFGILGPNGSGKSSFLNTASFTFKQTLGDIYYDGKNVLDRKGNEVTLGYCPQEDTLWDELTLYEHVEMFLYIRGYSKKESKKLAKQFIKYCRLDSHKNKMPSELSGGTRRKLNILISLCCSSSKILLDEPSAGMDPSTRRYVWDIIKSTIQNNKSSIIMTTHSMEEAELLCNRLAIIVNGKFRCIGSPEHLKMKFGNTYTLDLYTKDVEKFHKEIVEGKDLFGGYEYKRENKSLQRVKYEVSKESDISRVFDIMESCRDSGLYEDYSYSQTSLEQVFLDFAKLKENED